MSEKITKENAESKFGRNVKDQFTGFKGVLTGFAFYKGYSSCQITTLNDKQEIAVEWVDATRVVMCD